MKLRRLANSIAYKTGYPGKFVFAKDNLDMARKIAPILGWPISEVYNVYRAWIYDSNYQQSRGYSIAAKLYKPVGSWRLYGLSAYKIKPAKIIINLQIKEQPKKYIKHTILHEIGHYYHGMDEGWADWFANEWLEKI